MAQPKKFSHFGTQSLMLADEIRAEQDEPGSATTYYAKEKHANLKRFAEERTSEPRPFTRVSSTPAPSHDAASAKTSRVQSR
jgi:hypothetical protein